MFLFLDFDGVLHPRGASLDHLFCKSPLIESWLARVPDVLLVIASSWRTQHPLDEMLGYFRPGIRARIIGATPLIGLGEDRELEVLQWLRWFGKAGCSWAALDDQRELYSAACSHLVVCDGTVGLSDQKPSNG
jgi:hypothetical protein